MYIRNRDRAEFRDIETHAKVWRETFGENVTYMLGQRVSIRIRVSETY